MGSSVKLTNANKWLLIMILTPIVSVSYSSFIINLGEAFAQESAEEQGQETTGGAPPEEIVLRRVEVWGLFYRLMVVAFVVGAVVQGTIIYVSWRFRESNKKNQPRGTLEGLHR